MTTGYWNIGSVTDYLGNVIGWSNIPTTISGTTFNNMVEQEINFVEQYTSETIDSDAIPEKYQPAIIDLTWSTMLFSIDSINNSTSEESVKLGELSVTSSSSNPASNLAIQLRNDAINRLKELQRKFRFTRIIGGN